MSLGLILRRARHRAQLTTRAAADIAGIEAGSISRYENDENCPSFETAVKLSEAYQLPLDTMKDALLMKGENA